MPPADCSRIPMLLCNAGYYGTIAAIRSLGRAGVPVVAVDDAFLSPGRASRYTAAYLSSPKVHSADWSEWLLRIGHDGVRRALYATSDAVSFAIADRRDELSSAFDMYQPGLDTMMCILDKGLLYEHARAVGLDTPDTWFPESAREFGRVCREAGGQIVAKPRSQLCASSGAKAMLIDTMADGHDNAYDRLHRHFRLDNSFTRRFPEKAIPMLQRYHPESMSRIYSLSGFRDQSGSHVAIQAAVKIMQQPRRLGIGLCFEEADVILPIADLTMRLCERIGYYGAFELEFVMVRDRLLLIDFNGRFYNQLAFDIARGMDLPRLVYAAATGATHELQRLCDGIPNERKRRMVFRSKFGLAVLLAAQRTFRRMSREEAAHWRRWSGTHEGIVVDAIQDPDDPLPAAVDVVSRLGQYIRHPRKLVGDMGF